MSSDYLRCNTDTKLTNVCGSSHIKVNDEPDLNFKHFKLRPSTLYGKSCMSVN